MKVSVDIRRTNIGATTRRVICILAAALLAVPCLSAGKKSQQRSKGKPAGSFDEPVKKEVLHIGPTPQFPDNPSGPKFRTTISCYYFPHLLVKEYHQNIDCGGDVSYLRSLGKPSACKPSQQPGESAMGGEEWTGYFDGVKGNLVFSDFCEVGIGGLSFIVYDSTTGKKLFEDERGIGSPDLRVFSTKAGVVIKYVSAYLTDCNLHSSKKQACWEKVKAKLGLKSDRIPVCTGYDTIAQLVGTDQVESWVAYPVEVTLSPYPVIKAVACPVKCYPPH